MTEKDTVLYTNPIPIPKMQRKKRAVILEGTCGCGPIKKELIFNPSNLKAGEKDWSSTTHNHLKLTN